MSLNLTALTVYMNMKLDGLITMKRKYQKTRWKAPERKQTLLLLLVIDHGSQNFFQYEHVNKNVSALRVFVECHLPGVGNDLVARGDHEK